jgi:hypothetical protein
MGLTPQKANTLSQKEFDKDVNNRELSFRWSGYYPFPRRVKYSYYQYFLESGRVYGIKFMLYSLEHEVIAKLSSLYEVMFCGTHRVSNPLRRDDVRKNYDIWNRSASATGVDLHLNIMSYNRIESRKRKLALWKRYNRYQKLN